MLDPATVPEVDPTETLTRYILYSKHFSCIQLDVFRVKPDAFLPFKYVELSVTRHLKASEAELWSEGQRVSAIRKLNLYGRADVATLEFMKQSLAVVAKPLPENPNHADALGWPTERPAQMMKATLIAAAATFRAKPESVQHSATA